MRHILSYYIVIFFTLAIQGCSEDIDYKNLTTEENEILFENGNKKVIEFLCSGLYSNVSSFNEDTQYIYGKNYITENKNNIVKYCELASSLGYRNTACILKDYYRKETFNKQPHFTKFIVQLEKCGDQQELYNFINNDSVVLGIIEIIGEMLNIPETDNFLDKVKAIENSALALSSCRKDLEATKDKVSLFASQYDSLLTTIIDLENNYTKRADIGKKLLRGNLSSDIKSSVDKLNNDLKYSFSDLTKVALEVKKQSSNMDNKSIILISSILNEFIEKKEKYITKNRLTLN